mgnify:FL=1|tara:strand:- start:385 stop:612 length:228 start_codon:yes stop_codon:yes gene_type:complete
MEYNIGDMVVRRLNGRNLWDMIGIVTAKRPKYHTKKEKYYTIQWLDPKARTVNSDTWQVNEFVLIETAKKHEKNT